MTVTEKQNLQITKATAIKKLSSFSALLLTAPMICPTAALANTAGSFGIIAAPHIPSTHSSFSASTNGTHSTHASNTVVHQLLNPTPVWINSLNSLAQTRSVQNLFVPSVTKKTDALASTVKTNGISASNMASTAMSLAPIDLNLGSSTDTVLASTIPNFSNVTIKVGGQMLGVTSSTVLTQAEAAAVYQVLSTGKQSLVLDATGAATGGTLTVNSSLSQALDGLYIPKGVTVIDESGKNVAINLTNGLTNYGNLYLLSATGTGNTLGVSLTAPSLENEKGALISTDLPPSINNGSGYKDAASIDLTTNTLANDGSITAGNGAIIVQNAGSGNLTVIGAGSIAAKSVAFDLTSSSANAAPSLVLTNSSVLAKTIDFNNANGSVNVEAGSLTGGVNLTAASATVGTTTSGLTILSSNVSGDPTFTNSSPNGQLILMASQLSATDGESFTALSVTSVQVASSAATTLNASSPTNDNVGGNITIGAGVTFSGNTITGASMYGGSIKMGSVDLTTNGGDVTLIADGIGKSLGVVTIGNISTAATGAFNGGNVTITGANGVTVGNITATGLDSTGGAGGVVTISTTTSGNVKAGNISVAGGGGVDGGDGDAGDGGEGGQGGNGFASSLIGTTGQAGAGGAGGNSGMNYGGAGGVAPTKVGADAGAGGDGNSPGGAGGASGIVLAGASQPGYDGQNGQDGTTGANASSKGGNGGGGGSVTINAVGSITTGTITATGGAGGKGGDGGDGGGGGSGGGGGGAGPGIDSTATGGAGGPGYAGGNGGNGGNGGDGGNGTNGGLGGLGGLVSLTAGTTITTKTIDVSGGAGGAGGKGGDGGDGGYGGDGGNGSNGGVGGPEGLTYTYLISSIVYGSPSAQLYIQTTSSAGNGGAGGAGGNGGNAGTGGQGGTGGNGGLGGDAGTVKLSAAGAIDISQISRYGGAGGDGGDGGAGGNYGYGGDGGMGGNGASNSITAAPAGQPPPPPTTYMGFQVGLNPGVLYSNPNGYTAGSGGLGGVGGNGGNSSLSGDGANGGNGNYGGLSGNLIVTQDKTISIGNDLNYNGSSGAAGLGGAAGTGVAALPIGAPTPANGPPVFTQTAVGGPGGTNAGGTIFLTIYPNNTTPTGSAPKGTNGQPFQTGADGEDGQTPQPRSGSGTTSYPGTTITTPPKITVLPPPPTPPVVTIWQGSGGTANAQTSFVPLKIASNITPVSTQSFGNSDVITLNAASPKIRTADTISSTAALSNAALMSASNLGVLQPAFAVSSLPLSSTNLPSLTASSDNLIVAAGPIRDEQTLELNCATTLTLDDQMIKHSIKVAEGEEGEIEASAVKQENGRFILGATLKSSDISETSMIKDGKFLCMPEQDITIKSAAGNVFLRKHSMAFISVHGKELSVYNLSDARKGDVYIEVDGQRMVLTPGQQALLTEQSTTEFSEANPEQRIGWRSPMLQRLQNGQKAFLAEFSIASALANIEPIRQILKEKNGSDRSTIERALKNAAILASLTNTEYVTARKPTAQ